MLRYVVAVVAVMAALLLRFALQPWLGSTVPYLQFFPAILVAAWYGGLGPGLTATALAVLAAMYLFLPPDGFAVAGAGELISLLLFSAIGVAIAGLNHRLRRAEADQRGAAALATARAEQLSAIVDTTLDAIVVIDAHGLIEQFNHAAERMFGYPAAEVVGRNVSVLMPSPHHEQHDSYIERYLMSGDARVIGVGREMPGRRRDGSIFPVHLSVGEMTVGGQRKFTGLLHDLTKRAGLSEQLRASEARWQAIVDSAVDGIIVIDAYGRIEAFNPAAERLFGYTRAEVLARNVNVLMPSPYREEHDGYLARYLATGQAKIIGIGREVTGQRKNGTTFPLHLSVGAITLEGERKFTGIVHDLTPRVQIEERLREQTALARLGEMAGVVAHEVKNPLAGIRGALQVLAKRRAPETEEASILEEIIARIDALDAMMKDLLLFARPPRVRPVPTDIVPLVSTTANFISQDPLLKEVNVEVEGIAPLISVDAELLKIVFQNVLINGAHAMKGRGTIHVGVRTSDGTCEIAFTDRGPGIPAEIRGKIFTPFFTTKSRGTGLGLPTAKRIVEAHDGQMSVDCPPAGGTTVLITLPLRSAQAGDHAATT